MLTVKTGGKDAIIFPEKLISELGFRSGEKVNIKIKKGAVVITTDFFIPQVIENLLKRNFSIKSKK